MIYKFKQDDQDLILEIEHLKEREGVNMVELTIISQRVTQSIYLYKEDIYKLIGALHLIQKEMM
jgi:hypothetical protein